MIVFDEAHVALTSLGFREVVPYIPKIMRTGIPVTFLTATLPPRLRPLFEKAVHLPVGYKKIQAPTNRKEHQYALFRPKDKLVEKTAAFILKLSESLEPSQRGIIFVRKKVYGHSLQNFLQGVDFMHGGIVDEGVRDKMILDWKLGRSGGWIVGTTSLTQGIDYPDVHLVVFVDSPWGMIDFVQGAGRGGRNGKVSKIVVIDGGQHPKIWDSDDLGCAGEMASWMQNTAQCRRLIISRCIDGGDVTCHTLEGAAFCDICEPDAALQEIFDTAQLLRKIEGVPHPWPISTQTYSTPAEAPVKLSNVSLLPQSAHLAVSKHANHKKRLEISRAESAERCLEKIVAFGSNCAICHVLYGGLMSGEQHEMCFNKKGEELKAFYEWNKPTVKKQVRGHLSSFIYCRLTIAHKPMGWTYDGRWCWRCSLPQTLIKKRGPHKFEDCPWGDNVMLAVAWGVWHDEELFNEMKKVLGCPLKHVPVNFKGQGLNLPPSTPSERLAWFEWLAGSNEDGTAYNLHLLWLWYSKEKVNCPPGETRTSFISLVSPTSPNLKCPFPEHET